EHTGKRLDKHRAAVIDGVGHFQHVFHRNAAGDAHVFGIGPVVEEQVFAKIFLTATTVVAAQARSGIGGNHAHANAPSCVHALSHRRNVSNDFVSKDGRRLDHFGVIAALPDFEIGAVGQREANTEEHFVGSKVRHIYH